MGSAGAFDFVDERDWRLVALTLEGRVGVYRQPVICISSSLNVAFLGKTCVG
jgi:hypothetical protein